MGKEYPFRPFVASLFQDNKGRNQNPLFGEQARTQIGNYITGTSSNPYTSAFGRINTTGDFSSLPSELYDPYRQATSSLDEIIGKGRPILSALIETGMPVDVSNTVRNRYSNTILPTIAEQYNPAQGSAFQNIAGREAANLIAELEYPAEEAARERQLQGITVGAPTLASLTSTRLGLPAAALGELSSISQLTDPGGRLLSALLGILGYSQQPAQLRETTGGDTSSTGEILGVVGSLVGASCWVAEELFGKEDLRTLLARMWCLAHPDHPFVQRYRRYGQAWADEIRAHPELRPIVEPTWRWMAAQGAAMLAQHN